MQGRFRFDSPNDGAVLPENKRQITDHAQLLRFMFAGNATLTIRSLRTNERFTYRIKKPPEVEGEAPGPVGWFIAVLTGSDNTNDFTYLGHVYRESRDYVHGRKSKIGPDAASALAWTWFYSAVVLRDRLKPDKCEVWHEGRCGACNRKLTVPESIDAGFGPECAKTFGIIYKETVHA